MTNNGKTEIKTTEAKLELNSTYGIFSNQLIKSLENKGNIEHIKNYKFKSKILQSSGISAMLNTLREPEYCLFDTMSIEEVDEICKVFDSIYDKEIIEYFPEEMVDMWSPGRRVSISITTPLRSIYIDKAGFSIITKPLADKLSMFLKGKKCLEIMAGKGVLSKALQDRGIDIKPTDDKSWARVDNNHWMEVEDLEACEAIIKYKDVDYILASWIPMDIKSNEILNTIKEYNPNVKLIIIGEGDGGCTANDEWFEGIEECEDSEFYKLAIPQEMRSWFGIHDRIELYKVK